MLQVHLPLSQIANIWVNGTVTQTYLDNRYKGVIEIFC